MAFDFWERAEQRQQGSTSDEIEATSRAYDAVPEPIIVVDNDEAVYCEGIPRPGWVVDYSGPVPTVNGAVCVVLEPVADGAYRFVDGCTPSDIDEYRHEVFLEAYKYVRKHKYDDWNAQQDALRQQQVELEPAPPTSEEIEAAKKAAEIAAKETADMMRKFSDEAGGKL